MQLVNKRAVITGAGSGIGAAIARAYAEQGARLVLADRDAVTLTTTAQRCRELGVEVSSTSSARPSISAPRR